MLGTNLILLLAVAVMVGIAIWLFKDGDGARRAPSVRPGDADEPGGERAAQVRVVCRDPEAERTGSESADADEAGNGRDR